MIFNCCNIHSYIAAGSRLKTGGGGNVDRDLCCTSCCTLTKDDLLEPTEVAVVWVVESVEYEEPKLATEEVEDLRVSGFDSGRFAAKKSAESQDRECAGGSEVR